MDTDDGYISRYLIHWAGRDKPISERADALSTIASTCRLKLSQNSFFLDGSLDVREGMACFTDVPLRQSVNHCAKYSSFGIAFHKLALMNYGAQPVFYFSHVLKRDMGTIYRFVLDQLEKHSRDVSDDVFRALHRHFYFMQQFSVGRADAPDTHYYDREWRIGELVLVPEGENRGAWCLANELPTCIGEVTHIDGKAFLKFKPDDVAFLVCPAEQVSQIKNHHGFEVRKFEELVKPEPNTIMDGDEE